MAVIYESPDRGKTIHARPLNDYGQRRSVDPPHHPSRDPSSTLTEAAARFGGIERKPTTPATAAAARERARTER